MANGDLIGVWQQPSTIGPFSKGYRLLDQQATSGNGPWVDSSVLKLGSVEVFGTFTGSIQLYGTNQDQPADDYLGEMIGSSISTAGMIPVQLPFRYIRAVAALDDGSVSAYFYGVA